MVKDKASDSFINSASFIILIIINSFEANSKFKLNKENFIFDFLRFLENGLEKIESEQNLKPFLNIYTNLFKSKLIDTDQTPEIFNILLSPIHKIFNLVMNKFKEIQNLETQIQNFLFL